MLPLNNGVQGPVETTWQLSDLTRRMVDYAVLTCKPFWSPRSRLSDWMPGKFRGRPYVGDLTWRLALLPLVGFIGLERCLTKGFTLADVELTGEAHVDMYAHDNT